MQFILSRISYLFRATNGLVLVAMGITTLAAMVLGTLSGPGAELGIKDITVNLLGIDLQPLQRDGRLVVMYHSIAMAVVAIEVYFMTAVFPMKKRQQLSINVTVTFGYLLALFCGLAFAYFGHNWLMHSVFLFGLCLMYYAGILLMIAINPWKKENYITDRQYLSTPKGFDFERLAAFTLCVATLGSAIFGAAAGSYMGNGFHIFLAEDTIRTPHHSSLQLAVIGHLHIMLALVGVSITLIVGRWMDFKGICQKIAMPSMIFGTIVLTLGVWLVVPYQLIAHTIIYVGAVFVMWAGLMLVIFGWSKLIRERLAEQNIKKATFFQGLRALLHDPLKFGPLWQMVFMNFNCSFVGIFLAVKLEEIFRVWPASEERITLSGHWHILATLIASIILMYYADRVGMKGKARQWFGWILILGTDVAFASASIFSFKRLGVTMFGQQSFVDQLMLNIDIGLAATMGVLGLFLVWRLTDLVKEDGFWKKESDTVEAQEVNS